MNPFKLLLGMFKDPSHYAKAWGFIGPIIAGGLASLGLDDANAASVVQTLGGLVGWWLGTGLANAPAKDA